MNYKTASFYSYEGSEILNEDGIINESFKLNSFWMFLKTNYSFADVFLPNHLPLNNTISIDEELELKASINERDHYAIKEIIRLRYSKKINKPFVLNN